jgi:hypothetical protein
MHVARWRSSGSSSSLRSSASNLVIQTPVTCRRQVTRDAPVMSVTVINPVSEGGDSSSMLRSTHHALAV